MAGTPGAGAGRGGDGGGHKGEALDEQGVGVEAWDGGTGGVGIPADELIGWEDRAWGVSGCTIVVDVFADEGSSSVIGGGVALLGDWDFAIGGGVRSSSRIVLGRARESCCSRARR